MDPQPPNKLIAIKYCFLIQLGDDTSFFFFIFFFFFLLLLLLFYVIINFLKKYFIFNFINLFFYDFFLFFHVPGCSRMFRNIQACSGMFHVPGFIDAPVCTLEYISIVLARKRLSSFYYDSVLARMSE